LNFKPAKIDSKYLSKIFDDDKHWVDLYTKWSQQFQRQKADTSVVIAADGEEASKDLRRRSKRRKTDKITNELDEILKSSYEFYGLSMTESAEYSRQSDDILWTYKYQFTDENDIITNKAQIAHFKHWLEQLQKKSEKRPSSNGDDDDDDHDSDYSYDSECSSSSSTSEKFKPYSNAIILNGSTGCGKTSSVYCVANILNCKVFEVNTSNVRCKSQILQDLVGVLSSHHVVSRSKDSAPSVKADSAKSKTAEKLTPITNKIDGFFIKSRTTSDASTNPRKRRQDTPNTTPTTNANPVEAVNLKISKNSLILFDDIDVVLKDDKDFWSVINFFIKKSKKPIVLTCNDEFIVQKLSLNIEEIKFERPSPSYSLNYLKTICLCEGLYVDSDYLEGLLKMTDFDLRKAILQLQINVTSEKNSKSEKSSPSNFKIKTTIDVKDLSEYDYFLNNYIFCDSLYETRKSNFKNKKNSILLNYDYFLCKDGLADELSHDQVNNNMNSFKVDLHLKEHLSEKFGFNSFLFDIEHRNERTKPPANYVLNKFANKTFKFTSNPVLYLEYAPYLKAICKLEQFKQDSNRSRRLVIFSIMLHSMCHSALITVFGWPGC
jgi:DNA polymerase III delta prime subunit